MKFKKHFGTIIAKSILKIVRIKYKKGGLKK